MHNTSIPRRLRASFSTVIVVLSLATMAGLAACSVPTPVPTVAPTQAVSDEAKTHIEAAKTALKDKKFDVALTEAQAAVKADAQNSEAQYLLGNAYNQLGGAETDDTKRRDDLAKAVDAYLAAVKLDPKNDAAYTNLATVYYQNGQFDEAQAQVEAALKLKPDDAVSHYVLGTIHLQRDPKKVLDTLDKAEQEFLAALKSDPQLGAAYIGLANVYLFKGDNQKALTNAQKGVDLTKDAPSPYSYWALAQAQCAAGDKAGGAKSIETIKGFGVADTFFNQQVQALADRCK